MTPTPKPLLATLRGDRQPVPPIWLMRQAGRYLPEYRALRAEKGGFLALATDPAAAAAVTLQPIARFGFDGAILFSDILMVPWALGQDLSFGAGEGPRLAPPLIDHALGELEAAPQRLEAVYAAVREVTAMLPPATTFLGFAGSPWTVATYMVAGQGSKDHAETRAFAYRDEQAFGRIIAAIVDLTVTYLAGQIENGVEAVQLFDSWAGSLSPAQFERWVIAPNAQIVARLRALHPAVPIIGFPKGAGAKLAGYAAGVRPDAIGLDETIDPAWADAMLPPGLPVQGNLDPLALLAGGEALERGIDRVLAAFPERPHVFNLGHGIGQHTPIAHVEALIVRVRRGRGRGRTMMERLAMAYQWILAAHLIFVIFWMAGLFMLPRYLVYHQEALAAGRADEAMLWVGREAKIRGIILTPALVVVWVLGLTLATIGHHWGEGWLHAKLLLVIGLSGYHGWAVGYAKKLAGHRPTLDGRTLRMLNEIPALAATAIVVLAIVKPF